MSTLNFDYVPLTFIIDKEEIKKQIRNTLILIHLFERHNTGLTKKEEEVLYKRLTSPFACSFLE